jgi:transcriptional regulator with XRE-family HTH domain
LRLEHHWTQTELAARLQLSQARLSEIERGSGSFTAEQLLQILKLFNVTVDHFAPVELHSDAALQNTLARLGAAHLRESADVLPSERLREVNDVVREVLVSAASPRLLAALAPVLVSNIGSLSLTKLWSQLADAGRERRLGWVVDNTVHALDQALANVPKPLARLYRRARTVLATFLDAVTSGAVEPLRRIAPDILDPSIRSSKTVADVAAASSPISQRWQIITDIQTSDFSEALRAAHESR